MALCNITGTLYYPNGEPARTRKIIFHRAPESVVAQYLGTVLPDDMYTISKYNGDVDFKLLTGEYIGVYEGSHGRTAFNISVPEDTDARLEDCIAATDPVLPWPAWLTEAVAARDRAEAAAVIAEAARDEAVAAIGVAGIAPSVIIVADNIPSVVAVGDSIDSVNAVADSIDDIGVVAGSVASIDAVAAISADVSTVAGDSDDIAVLAGITGDIGAVAGVAGDIPALAGVAGDIPTVANNIADVTNFAKVYIGPKAADPTLRNDGSALMAGDLYFNTTTDLLRVFDGDEWENTTSQSLNMKSQSFTGTGSATAFTLSMIPVIADNVIVWVGGVRKVPTADYTVSGTTLTFATAPGNGVPVDTLVISTVSTLYAPADGTVTEQSFSDEMGVTVASRAVVASIYLTADLAAFRALGYAAAGDGGEATYKRVASEPSHAGKVQSADGAWWELAELIINPAMFGAKGDGLNDDGPAISNAFSYVRSQIQFGYGVPTELSLHGKRWRVATPVNATGIVAWNFTISGGIIHGVCTGKPIFDMVGSRGYRMDGVGFYGDKTLRPSCAYQVARTTTHEYCDNLSFEDVSTWGYFSRAAVHVYGHETTTHFHCTYFNYDHTARVAIFEGFSGTAMTSDYATIVSGAVSFINNKVINCDFRYLPVEENSATVSGVTKGATNTTITTATPHSFTVGSKITLAYIGGMPNASTVVAIVTAVTSTTVTFAFNSSGWGTYTGGGMIARGQDRETVYLSRFSGFDFDCSYIVAYGNFPLLIDFPDATDRGYEHFDGDILFEGSGIGSCIAIYCPDAATYSITDARLRTYSAPNVGSYIDFVGNASALLSLYSPKITVSQSLYSDSIVNAPTRMSFYNADISIDDYAASNMLTMVNLIGSVSSINTGKTITRGEVVMGTLKFEGVTTAGAAGAGAGYLVINIDGTNFKVAINSM